MIRSEPSFIILNGGVSKESYNLTVLTMIKRLMKSLNLEIDMPMLPAQTRSHKTMVNSSRLPSMSAYVMSLATSTVQAAIHFKTTASA